MPSVTGFTAARMLEIENSAIVNGEISGDNLILMRKDGIQLNAGNVRGPEGPQMPPGSLTMSAAALVPNGWLACFGQAISRALYPALFTAIGTQYGAGDGTTTFNLPDLRGRVPVGLDNMGGSDAGRLSVANTLGGDGGAEKHTLTSAEMPSHTHGDGTLATSTAGNHDHTTVAPGYITIRSNPNAALITIEPASTAVGSFEKRQYMTDDDLPDDGAHTHTISGNTASAGSGGSHNNMQPYILLNYIIKY